MIASGGVSSTQDLLRAQGQRAGRDRRRDLRPRAHDGRIDPAEGHRHPVRLTMLKARVIPCLDVKDGRTVKGVNFVDLVDAGDPVEQARIYDGQGADELCFLDITASHENRDTLFGVVNRTRSSASCRSPWAAGGGRWTI